MMSRWVGDPHTTTVRMAIHIQFYVTVNNQDFKRWTHLLVCRGFIVLLFLLILPPLYNPYWGRCLYCPDLGQLIVKRQHDFKQGIPTVTVQVE
jgi:hypothetical protein